MASLPSSLPVVILVKGVVIAPGKERSVTWLTGACAPLDHTSVSHIGRVAAGVAHNEEEEEESNEEESKRPRLLQQGTTGAAAAASQEEQQQEQGMEEEGAIPPPLPPATGGLRQPAYLPPPPLRRPARPPPVKPFTILTTSSTTTTTSTKGKPSQSVCFHPSTVAYFEVSIGAPRPPQPDPDAPRHAVQQQPHNVRQTECVHRIM